MVELDPSGVAHEVDFWQGFVKTDRFKLWVADTPTPELDTRVAMIVKTAASVTKKTRRATILDVGSGPVSILRGTVDGVSACDPLSTHYQTLFDYTKHGILPPAPYAAENLPLDSMWSEAFDVVHISNALDHVKDVTAALENLVRCVVPGGLLIVQGHVCEATHEGRAGFHQHDLYLANGALYSQNKRIDIYTAETLGCSLFWSEQFVNASGRSWFIWVLEKNKSVS